MIQVSNTLKTYMNTKNVRNFKAKILVNDKDIDGNIKGYTLTKGSGGSYLQPASLCSQTLDANIELYTNSTKVKDGDKLTIMVSSPASGDSNWYKIGTLFASGSSRKIKNLSLKGVGTITAKLGRKYSGGNASTVSQLINNIKALTGVNIYVDTSLDSNITINTSAKLTDYYCRELCGYIAGLYFGYCTEDKDGNVWIKSYKRTSANSTITASPSRMRSDPTITDSPKIVGVEISTKESETFLYPNNTEMVNLSLRNPIMTNEAFNTYVGDFVNLDYQAFDMSMSLGDFTLEDNDIIKITTRDGNTYNNLRCVNISQVYDGGIITKVSCPSVDNPTEYSRGEVNRNSSIGSGAMADYGGGDIGDTGNTEIQSEYKFIPLCTSGATWYRYREYLQVHHGSTVHFFGNASSKIPAEYAPKYPVTVYAISKSEVVIQWTILPTCKKNPQYVDIECCYSWISPKDDYEPKKVVSGFFGDYVYPEKWGNHENEDIKDYTEVKFNAFWITKKAWDKIKHN